MYVWLQISLKMKKILIIFSLIYSIHNLMIASNPDSTKIEIKKKKKIEGPRGFEFSGNFGGYFANKYNAQYYNGNSVNENNIDFVLKNQYWFDEIKNILRTSINRDSIMLSELPTNMKYSPSMYVGFGVRYNYTPSWALNIQFNFTKLIAKDFFTFQVFPAFDNENRSYVKYGIIGSETRNNIEIGVLHTFMPEKIIRPFAEVGVLFTNTKVKESKILIESSEYSLINIYSGSYIPNTQLQENNILQGGLSFGGYFSGGVKFVFNDFASFEVMASLYYKQINLQPYKDFKIHGAGMVRLILSPAFFIKKEEM